MEKKQNITALVRQSNHLLNGRSEGTDQLTLTQRNIILYMISKIKSTDDMFKLYEFTYDELNSFLKIGDRNHKELEKIIDQLYSKKIKIREGKNWTNYRWINQAKYQDGIYYLNFDSGMEPFLLQLREYYTEYELRYILALASTTTQRIYELLKQYEKIGWRQWELEDLKADLGIPDTYRNYYEFKRWVVLPAQKLIGANTDICFTFDEIKTGRKVTALKFFIRPNKPDQKQDTDDFSKGINRMLQSYKMPMLVRNQKTEILIRNLLQLEDENPGSIERIISSVAKMEHIENKTAFLISNFDQIKSLLGSPKASKYPPLYVPPDEA
jgi:plasmid replication initiation protein